MDSIVFKSDVKATSLRLRERRVSFGHKEQESLRVYIGCMFTIMTWLNWCKISLNFKQPTHAGHRQHQGQGRDAHVAAKATRSDSSLEGDFNTFLTPVSHTPPSLYMFLLTSSQVSADERKPVIPAPATISPNRAAPLTTTLKTTAHWRSHHLSTTRREPDSMSR